MMLLSQEGNSDPAFLCVSNQLSVPYFPYTLVTSYFGHPVHMGVLHGDKMFNQIYTVIIVKMVNATVYFNSVGAPNNLLY